MSSKGIRKRRHSSTICIFARSSVPTPHGPVTHSAPMPLARLRPPLTCATIVLLGLLLAACSSSGATTRHAITPEEARASFEEAWSAVERSDPDPDHGGVDWNAVRERFAPRAAACTSRESLRLLLSEMFATLGRSHFGVIAHGDSDRLVDAPDQDAAPGTTGLDLRLVESRVLVTGVQPGSPAARAGVARGWTLERADGKPAIGSTDDEDEGSLARYARNASARALDQGPAGGSVQFDFLDASGTPQRHALVRESPQGTKTQLGVLPEFTVHCSGVVLDAAALRAMGAPEDLRIGVIAFNAWMPVLAAQLDAAVDRLRDCDGIVIDLRGNPGGVGAMAMGFAGHFHDAPDSLGAMRTRDTTLEFRVNPRRSTADGRVVEPFAGPLAIVMDPLSASTSEIFAGGLQALGRARVFGRTSAGAALPAQMRRLPSGDAVMFAFGDFTLPDGRSLEGSGVHPDETSGTRADEWRAECDPDLRAATHWISRTLRDKDCHE